MIHAQIFVVSQSQLRHLVMGKDKVKNFVNHHEFYKEAQGSFNKWTFIGCILEVTLSASDISAWHNLKYY